MFGLTLKLIINTIVKGYTFLSISRGPPTDMVLPSKQNKPPFLKRTVFKEDKREVYVGKCDFFKLVVVF